MEGQDYLDQISASNRPQKSSMKTKILSSAFFKVGAIGLGALVLIMIIGALIGGNGSPDVKELCYALKLRLDNTSSLIQEYQPNVKSSALRSSSASLQSVFSNTNKDLTEFLTEKYAFKEKDISKNIVEEATLNKDALQEELFQAKINGVLDRTYARKMTFEVSYIMNEEAKIMNSTKDENLSSLLKASIDSLKNLYSSFNDFSETK